MKKFTYNSTLSRLLKSIIAPLAILALWIAVLFYIQPIGRIHDGYLFHADEERADTVLPVYADHSIDQTFSILQDANELEIHLQPGYDLSDRTYQISLYDDKGNFLGSWNEQEAPVDTPKNTISVNLPNLLSANSEEHPFYLIHIESSADAGYMLPVLAVTTDNLGEFSVIPDHGMISLSYAGTNTNATVVCLDAVHTYPNLPIIMALIGAAAAAVIWFFLRHKSIRIYSLPVLFGSAWIIMCLIMPYNGPDEDYHYNSSFTLSSILMNQEDVYAIPEPYNDLSGLDYNTNTAHSYVTITRDLLGEFAPDGKTGADNGSALTADAAAGSSSEDEAAQNLLNNTYGVRTNDFSFPAEYFLQAIGITIGRLLHLSVYKVYYLGRLFNFLGYFILVYAAILLIPVNKELVLMVAALPGPMMQACSLSYDSPQNGAAILLFALIIRLCCLSRRIEWRDSLPLLLAACLMGPVKIIYLAMLLLLFMIPGSSFAAKTHAAADENKRAQPWLNRNPTRGHFLCAIIGISLVFTAATRLQSLTPFLTGATSSFHLAASAAQSGDLSAYQMDPQSSISYYTIQFAFHHPGKTIRLFLNTWLSTPLQWLSESVGILDLNGQTTSSYGQLGDYSVLPFAILLILCALKRKGDGYQMRRRDGGMILITGFVFTILMTATAMMWTLYGRDRITGIQGRYFIFLLLPLFWCFMQLNIPAISRNRRAKRSRLFLVFWLIEIYVIQAMAAAVA